ncbi:ABC transporter substrate-binding protein [Rothia sp. AR01]|uniref:ABC transporter substrate-binding protein n=1 Tax=Rothia santali TaxID=2949643 RepID=A0A9X2KID8_9MICC|nr:ABC transporter substrate-binding protein [Rothia santali]MCP3425905.1 ABC transporter substrate-binding protein [Rothia santali]
MRREASDDAHRLTRRALLGGGALGALAAGLSGCGAGGGAGGAQEITLYQNKREAIDFFRGLVSEFNEAHSGRIRVIHDTTPGSLSAQFARSTPPALGAYNYNFEMSRFQERGELSDLSDLAEKADIRPAVQDLVDQYPTYPGRTSVIPYSIMGSGVLYNQEVFERHGLEVPTTYSEFLELCGTLRDAGVTPIYQTSGDAWTLAQGVTDYAIGGMLDVAGFFERLRGQGDAAGPDAEVSFSHAFREPFERALEIHSFANSNAASRKYGDGNVAFAQGDAAMYFQGPWALTEIDTINPDARIGVFPLPMTEDPADRKIRVNLDLALWIPESIPHPDAARELLDFLITPELADEYNQANLGFGVRNDSPPIADPRMNDLQGYVDRAAFYQGASVSIPRTILYENYVQGVMTGDSVEGMLRTLDEDWARLARRQ